MDWLCFPLAREPYPRKPRSTSAIAGSARQATAPSTNCRCRSPFLAVLPQRFRKCPAPRANSSHSFQWSWSTANDATKCCNHEITLTPRAPDLSARSSCGGLEVAFWHELSPSFPPPGQEEGAFCRRHTLPRQRTDGNHCNFAYSALASCRMGMSGSASFQRAKKS